MPSFLWGLGTALGNYLHILFQELVNNNKLITNKKKIKKKKKN